MRLFEGTAFDIPPRCERCGELVEVCQCVPEPEPTLQIPPEDQTAHLAVEKRKRGKLVTTVRGLPAEGNDLDSLLATIKTACGAGGTVKEDRLEIQGDHVVRVESQLRALGYRVQRN